MKNESPLNTPRRVLVIMLRRIGDVVLTTPAVRALRTLFPKAQIDFLTQSPCQEILSCDINVNRVLVHERGSSASTKILGDWRCIRLVREGRYDWVIDYMGNPRSAIITAFSGAAVRAGPAHVFHRWAYSHRLVQSQDVFYAGTEKIRVLRSLGLRADEADHLPKLLIPQGSRLWAQNTLESLGWARSENLIGFAPASRKITRQWPLEKFADLGRQLTDKMDARILVLWGPGEDLLAEEIADRIGNGRAAAPETKTLQDLAALTSRCRLLITNCNGPKHIAVGLGVPTLTIHGSSDPTSWNPPHEPNHQIVRRENLFCIGCRLNKCPYNLECLSQLSADEVALRAEQMLKALKVATE